MAVFTPDDPCKYLTQLKDAYSKIITGTQASAIEYLSNGVTRRTEYSKASIQDLKQEIASAQIACDESKGQQSRSRRFAITAGSRRPFGGGF